MSNKLKKGFALRRMFVDGELIEPGEPCSVPEGDAGYLDRIGKFTTDKDKAAAAKKARVANEKAAA